MSALVEAARAMRRAQREYFAGRHGPNRQALLEASQRAEEEALRIASSLVPTACVAPPRVWTARIGYRGCDGLDVTRKSAGADGRPFAPSWAILSPELDARRRGEDAAARWPAYVAAYEREMRESERRDPGAWQRLLGRESVTLLCYCDDPAHCHRSVLARLLGARGATVCGERPAASTYPEEPLAELVEQCVDAQRRYWRKEPGGDYQLALRLERELDEALKREAARERARRQPSLFGEDE